MEKRWDILDAPPQSFLDTFPELPTTVAHLLYHRNVRTQEQVDEFFHPDYSNDVHDPFLFADMQKAVDRIFTAIEKNELITIHGDYDADGVSASVILADLFDALGFTEYDTFLPHRETDGYGLNTRTVDMLAEQGTKVIITCDCGISNVEEIARANEHGIDVIVTDHHSIPPTLPDAYAIIHPKIETENYPDKGLAGGGVAFKLMQAMLRTHAKNNDTLPNGESHESHEKWSLDMVAIASVADMVPLIGESRTLTKYGLIVLNQTRRVGLKKLYEEIKLMHEDGSMKQEITAETIAFQIAPRINAAGRLDHANVALKLILEKSPIEATNLAYELNQNNEERKKLTEGLVRDARAQIKEQLNNPVLFAIGDGWQTGVVGLIAGKLKEQYQKPVIVMAKNNGDVTGSGRSVDGFNMIAALQDMPECFTKFGGHPMACGFTLAADCDVETMQEKLISLYNQNTKDLDMTPTLTIDADVTLEDVNWDLYDVLAQFEPFGQMNPKPKYVARGLTVTNFQPLGKDGNHMKLLVQHTTPKIRKAVGWRFCTDTDNGQPNWCKTLHVGDKIDMVFEVDVNQWNGNRELQLTIVDLRKSE